MYFLEIRKGGELLAVAGSDYINRLVLTLNIVGGLGPKTGIEWYECYLNVAGVSVPDLKTEMHWAYFQDIRPGEIIDVTILEKANPTTPLVESILRKETTELFDRKNYIALECSVNFGKKIVAGAADLMVLDCTLEPTQLSTFPIKFHVSGVLAEFDSPEIPRRDIDWLTCELGFGDSFRLKIVDTDKVDAGTVLGILENE